MGDHKMIPMRLDDEGAHLLLVVAAAIVDRLESLREGRGDAPWTGAELALAALFRQAIEAWERLTGQSFAGEGYAWEWL